ncbi:uncharacterized protein LOC134845839 [Symsagittifera roscoffensis]|uniref:uncharacterized protein LOC134845839 n=1 Tax=Symsagittifera roscoffensis TaxID=84072 RepID=UPI00307B5847
MSKDISQDRSNASSTSEQDETFKWLQGLWANSKTVSGEQEYYERSASEYEQIHQTLQWRAPELCMKAIADYEEKSGVKLDQKGRCLDIGAGTGLSGEALRRAGFTGQVDALEPVEGMFAQAKKKNIYTEWFQEFLDDKKESKIPSATYDLAVSVGVFNDRSAKSSCLTEVMRMIKPGGYLAAILREAHWKGDFEDEIKRLEDERILSLKHVDRSDVYYDNVSSMAFILQKN